MRTGWHPHPVLISKSKWQPDEYAIRLSFLNKMTFFFKWQPDGVAIRLSFYFEMTIGWGVIRFSFYFKMTTGWHTHPIVFFLKYKPNEIPSSFHFFVYMNRIVTVVELKFYIGVQKECIRMQEEFVNKVLSGGHHRMRCHFIMLYFILQMSTK